MVLPRIVGVVWCSVATMAEWNECEWFRELNRVHKAIHYECRVAIMERWSEESIWQAQDIVILSPVKCASANKLTVAMNSLWYLGRFFYYMMNVIIHILQMINIFLIYANACFSCCYPMTTFSMKPFSECMLNRLLWQTFLSIVQDLKADSTLSSDFNALVFIFKWYIIKHIFPWYSWTSNCSHSQPSIFAVGSNIMIWICVLSKLIAIFHEWDPRMSNIISDLFDHILPEIDMPLIRRCAFMKHTFFYPNTLIVSEWLVTIHFMVSVELVWITCLKHIHSSSMWY